MYSPFLEDLLLENARVRLTPIKDIEDSHLLEDVAFNNEDLLRYSPSHIHNAQLLKSYFETALKERTQKTRLPLIIYDKKMNSYAGSTSFMNISEYHERLEIGSTWIGRDFQRSGLNRNMKLLMLAYAFDQLECKRVELKTDARNTKSRNAIVAIGAKYEGCLRSHTLMTDGYRRDTVYYSILLEEWPNVKSMLSSKIL